jgi:predicted nuclease of predicted toxin-antitoxin system
MRFLVDAQLPRRLAAWLSETGFDTVHTLDLPFGNRTPDTLINDVSTDELGFRGFFSFAKEAL